MFSATARKTLVLNADMQPLSLHPLSMLTMKDAIKDVVSGDVDVVEEWPEEIRSPSITMRAPKVVVLRDYVSIWALPKFCRRSVYLRDRFRCQYCGEPFPTPELSFDHVIPRDKGGQTVWENILTCCIECNKRKRNQHADWSGRKGGGMRPLKAPRQPSAAELRLAALEFIDEDIKADFGSWIYWNAELRA